jgi:hypothetical protein
LACTANTWPRNFPSITAGSRPQRDPGQVQLGLQVGAGGGEQQFQPGPAIEVDQLEVVVVLGQAHALAAHLFRDPAQFLSQGGPAGGIARAFLLSRYGTTSVVLPIDRLKVTTPSRLLRSSASGTCDEMALIEYRSSSCFSSAALTFCVPTVSTACTPASWTIFNCCSSEPASRRVYICTAIGFCAGGFDCEGGQRREQQDEACTSTDKGFHQQILPDSTDGGPGA